MLPAGLIDAYDAAQHFGVSPATVRTWQRRGLVRPVHRCGRRLLYAFDDLAAVEAQTRTSGCGRQDLRRTARPLWPPTAQGQTTRR